MSLSILNFFVGVRSDVNRWKPMPAIFVAILTFSDDFTEYSLWTLTFETISMVTVIVIWELFLKFYFFKCFSLLMFAEEKRMNFIFLSLLLWFIDFLSFQYLKLFLYIIMISNICNSSVKVLQRGAVYRKRQTSFLFLPSMKRLQWKSIDIV